MPVPIRDTPLGRALYEEGWREGFREACRAEALRITAVVLRRRFGDDTPCLPVLAALADLPEREFVSCLFTDDYLEVES